MEPQFTNLGTKDNRRRLGDLELLCAHARSIEEIVLGWVARGKSLIISRNPDVGWSALGFSFLSGRETVALATIPLDRLLPSYPDFEPLNETMLKFDDQQGFCPDNEWFDKRNMRLGIFTHEGIDMNLAPPAAIGELILSYALSTVGYAEISMGKRMQGTQFLRLNLVFFGSNIEEPETGWYENACINHADLKHFVPRAYWM